VFGRYVGILPCAGHGAEATVFYTRIPVDFDVVYEHIRLLFLQGLRDDVKPEPIPWLLRRGSSCRR